MINDKQFGHSICLSLEEVAVHTAHEVLMEVDNNILLIVGDLQRILDHSQSHF